MGGAVLKGGARVPVAAALLASAGALVLLAGSSGPPPGRVVGKVVTRAAGAPKPDASGVVVYVVGFTEPPPAAIAEMRQEGKTFLPALLAITAGQTVSFPNKDPFFHNVFSLSPPRPFDLGQFTGKTTKMRAFPTPGVVDVYCNIHPEMAATILVLPNRRFATTARDGTFAIEGVPPGAWTAYAYDPLADKPVRTDVAVAAGAVAEIALPPIDETRTRLHLNKFGERYRDAKGTYGR